MISHHYFSHHCSVIINTAEWQWWWGEKWSVGCNIMDCVLAQNIAFYWKKGEWKNCKSMKTQWFLATFLHRCSVIINAAKQQWGWGENWRLSVFHHCQYFWSWCGVPRWHAQWWDSDVPKWGIPYWHQCQYRAGANLGLQVFCPVPALDIQFQHCWTSRSSTGHNKISFLSPVPALDTP